MEIFNWVKEIENMYNDIVEKAKSENLNDIKSSRAHQEELLEQKVKRTQEKVKAGMRTLSLEENDKANAFNLLLNDLIDKIEKNIQENKDELINLIIKKLGFNF